MAPLAVPSGTVIKRVKMTATAMIWTRMIAALEARRFESKPRTIALNAVNFKEPTPLNARMLNNPRRARLLEY
jgi:hypothetical protein